MAKCSSLRKKANSAFTKFEKIDKKIENTTSRVKRLTLQKKADKIYDVYLKNYTLAGRCETNQKGKIKFNYITKLE